MHPLAGLRRGLVGCTAVGRHRCSDVLCKGPWTPILPTLGSWGAYLALWAQFLPCKVRMARAALAMVFTVVIWRSLGSSTKHPP